MLEETFRAVQDGATVITAGGRLARVLTRDFHRLQREHGRSVWQRPDVLPLEAFLDRAWRDWLWHPTEHDAPLLLSPFQEQLVWEQVIRESPAGESLLRIPETAREAREAWQLVHAYRLPVDGRFEATEDWAAFAAWSRSFRRRLQTNHWLERARLSDFLREQVAFEGSYILAGFEDLAPQQSELIAVLPRVRTLEPGECRAVLERRRLRDSSHEIRAAAQWARRRLEQSPDAEIGVIVPDLTRLRPRVERIFQEVLDPAGGSPDRERSFHLSLGQPLGDYPLVRAALEALEFGVGAMPLPQVGMLLRSPFFGGAEAEWTRRAQLDARLRRDGVWDVTVERLRGAAGNCSLLQRILRRFDQELHSLPSTQRPSEWSRDFSRLLDALGWPGERPLTSREFQTREAWQNALSGLSELDIAAPQFTFHQALDRLRELSAATVFQVQSEDAHIQVMGILEASGLSFDHLWIMGLHDDALPSPPSPNPFLPTPLQREFKLPHSSAERELDFGTKLMGRLLRGAPDVVLSYPETDGDRALAPSPLVPGGSWLAGEDQSQLNEWVAGMRAKAEWEEITDEAAPALIPNGEQRGGARLFQDIAACPFRAFARHRLNAQTLEDADPGLNYRDRGTAVHKALQNLWAELASHAHLIELTPDELREVLVRSVDAAVATLGPGIGRDLEQRRLETLLAEWLEIEKSRGEFRVCQSEQDRVAEIGGLTVTIRTDRVDELPDGRQIILDYKTGKVNTSSWAGDRPEEPQLPLYCATGDRPPAGAAFALIRTGESGFLGLTDGPALPSMKAMKMEVPGPFAQQVAAWRSVLERLARDFRSGKADVDPSDPSKCDHCGLRALCRIRELEHERR